MKIRKKLKETYKKGSYIYDKCKAYRVVKNSPLLKKYLNKNVQFKNLHKGERCFVLGNGPSLNDEKLSLLENEWVFTVNKIAGHLEFEKIKTNYHFFADPSYFTISFSEGEADNEHFKRLISIKTKQNNPVCFFPYYAIDFINKYELEKILDIRVYYPFFTFRDNEKEDIDFTKPTLGYESVVQYAVAMAIYMGFAEIYLLGCDCTGIINDIQAFLKEDVTEYAYAVNEKEREFINIMNSSNVNGIERKFLSWARILHLHGELYKYCNERGISLYNCSSKTIIDSIPRISLTDVLERKTLQTEKDVLISV